MPLVSAICTQCGATLKVDSTRDAAICQHCGAAFVVEKAINNYTVHNHINAGTVNVWNQKDFVIRAGVLEKYEGEETIVVIPENVQRIGCQAFKQLRELQCVKIPHGVRRIDAGAFSFCENLQEIDIADSVEEIGGQCFMWCKSLKMVRLPRKLKFVENGVFYGAISLSCVEWPEEIEGIHGDAFRLCSALTEVQIPQSVKWVGAGAFAGSGLRRVIIENSKTVLHDGSFGSCKHLQTVVFEKMIGEEDVRAFCNTPWAELEKVKILNNLKQLYRGRGLCQWCGGGFKGLFRHSCENCGKIKDY